MERFSKIATWVLLSPSSKNEKNHCEKISYILSKKAFLMFQETVLSHIHETELSYISGNGNPKKL